MFVVDLCVYYFTFFLYIVSVFLVSFVVCFELHLASAAAVSPRSASASSLLLPPTICCPVFTFLYFVVFFVMFAISILFCWFLAAAFVFCPICWQFECFCSSVSAAFPLTFCPRLSSPTKKTEKQNTPNYNKLGENSKHKHTKQTTTTNKLHKQDKKQSSKTTTTTKNKLQQTSKQLKQNYRNC